MATQIKLRRGTSSEWTSVNPTLAAGEAGVETDTNKIKIGDGSTAWTSLNYAVDFSSYATQTYVNNSANTKVDKTITINEQTGTTYTLVLSDASKLVELNNASAITLTVPANSSVAYDVGTKIDLLQTGAGQVTVTGAGGVTINGFGNATKLSGQWAAASLVKRATDTWVMIGNISA